MEFFKKAEVFRLKSSHHNKYLAINQDEETMELTNKPESTKGYWAIERVEGKSNIIRVRSCHSWKYLAAIDKTFLLGMTGNKVVQRLRLDATVEWEPIKEGNYVKLKSHVGTFLRANRGPPPWRNSVTHDPPGHWTAKEDMILWVVDIVKLVGCELGNGCRMTEVDVANEVSGKDYSFDDEKSRDSESFGKLKSMLAALEDEVCSTEVAEIIASKET